MRNQCPPLLYAKYILGRQHLLSSALVKKKRESVDSIGCGIALCNRLDVVNFCELMGDSEHRTNFMANSM